MEQPERGTRDCPNGCAGIHSYTHLGQRWCWRPDEPGRFALDVELVTAAPPDRLLRRWRQHHPLVDQDDFWVHWTQAEALAKLTNVPILAWLQHHDLGDPSPAWAVVQHRVVGDVMCCFAWVLSVQNPAEVL